MSFLRACELKLFSGVKYAKELENVFKEIALEWVEAEENDSERSLELEFFLVCFLGDYQVHQWTSREKILQMVNNFRVTGPPIRVKHIEGYRYSIELD
jgi:hypothetical protein